MNTAYQKRLAARILKCSPGRVKVASSKEVEEALTRNDVRGLIVKGFITKKPKKGTSRVKANYLASQKKKGRRKGRGRKSGTKYARGPRKQEWMRNTRALRRLLRELKNNGQIKPGTGSGLYRKIKGAEFRNKKHMLAYLNENGIIVKAKKGGKGGKG